MRERTRLVRRSAVPRVTSTPSSTSAAAQARGRAAPVAGLDFGRAERLGHRVGLVQPSRYTYSSKSGGPLADFIVDTDSPGVIKLASSSNNKVSGSLTYRHDKGSTTLKVVQAFPQGYGLGTVLLYYLGELALKNGSKVIEIGAPALTEIGFYKSMGATFTGTEATKGIQKKLLLDDEIREETWRTIVQDSSMKSWDSGAYFEGKVNKRFNEIPFQQQQSVHEGTAYGLKEKKDDLVNAYLLNRGAYMTSPDGLIFRDIPQMMELASLSIAKRWKLEG